MRTLIYHAGALGDVVATLPLFKAWNRLHPHNSFTFLGNRTPGRLGIAAGYFSRAWDIDEGRFAPLFSGGASGALREEIGGFDAALACAADDSPFIRALHGAGVPRILHQPPFPTGGQPVVDYHLSLLGDRILEPACAQPQVTITAPPAGFDPGRFSGCIAIHPGSGSPAKNWPAGRFLELAKVLAANTGRRIAWITGPAEHGMPSPAECEPVADRDIVELAVLLSVCGLYAGNDSGVSHLAAAVGAPVVALFGPTDPAVWAPRGRAVAVVHEPAGLDRIAVDRVAQAALSLL